jgi:hypothetical protein
MLIVFSVLFTCTESMPDYFSITPTVSWWNPNEAPPSSTAMTAQALSHSQPTTRLVGNMTAPV